MADARGSSAGRRVPRAGAPRPRRMRAGDRREDILDAVARHIVADGLDVVTMESAAASAGVSKALVYRHFANRDDLLVAVLSREITRLGASTDAAVAGTKDFRTEIAAALPSFLDVASRGSGLVGTLIHTTHLGKPLRRLRRGFVDAAEAHWARRAARAFGLSEGDARIAAAVFLGGLGGLGEFEKRSGVRRADVERVFAELVVGALERLAAAGGRRTKRRG